MTISNERLKEIEAIADEAIDYSDIPETDESFWLQAEAQMPESATGLYVRLDPDLLRWLQRSGPAYQTRINAILRSYMESHSS